MVAVLNVLDIMSCDLENVYLNATNLEKIWFEGGIECSEDKGKVLVVVRALYVLKSIGLAWRVALAKTLVQLGFKSTRADPDVWIRAAVCLDGGKYYEILFLYVDDILAISHKATEVITEITSFSKAKEGSIKPLNIYLGTSIDKIQMPDGRKVWGSSSRDYVNNAITAVERLFEEYGEGFTFRNSIKNPFPTGYKPELDVTEELGPEMISRSLASAGGQWSSDESISFWKYFFCHSIRKVQGLDTSRYCIMCLLSSGSIRIWEDWHMTQRRLTLTSRLLYKVTIGRIST